MSENETLKSKAYALQFVGVIAQIAAFIMSSKRSLSLPIRPEFATVGTIEWSQKGAMHTFTRAEIKSGLFAALGQARKHGPQACRSLPATPNKNAFIIKALNMTYAKNGRNLLLVGLGKARKAMKDAATIAATQAAIDAGTAWVAEGVVDKDGASKVFHEEDAARRAWCRHKDNYGAEWYQDADGNSLSKADKNARKSEAVVTLL